jgi:bleomycin hydrolase
MIKNKNKTAKIKKDTLENVFYILVKFLGEPPKTFDWLFTDEEGNSTSICKLTPFKFKEMVLPGIELKDFILLSNIPSEKFKFYKKYVIKNTNNVFEKDCCEVINIPIKDLKYLTRKSILSGMPVWFAGDVGKSFHPYTSTLSNKVVNTDLLLNKGKDINKKERIFITNQKTSHAMTFMGVNLCKNGVTASWQVENSWGYYDNEIPGLDGFLYMDDEWFDEFVGEVVIHKKYLSRKISKVLDTRAEEINPWESVAPALKVNGEKFYNMNFNLFSKINKLKLI